MSSDDRTRFLLEHTYVTIPCVLMNTATTTRGDEIRRSTMRRWRHEVKRIVLFRYAWTWSLILSDVSDDDTGEYTCRVSSDDDQTLTIIKRFNLTVLSEY